MLAGESRSFAKQARHQNSFQNFGRARKVFALASAARFLRQSLGNLICVPLSGASGILHSDLLAGHSLCPQFPSDGWPFTARLQSQPWVTLILAVSCTCPLYNKKAGFVLR